MNDYTAATGSKPLADSLRRLWNEPTAATCRRLSREAQSGQEADQLNAWEDDGGTTAPRRTM